MKAVEVKNLTKKYKDKTAVDSISFSVEKGELFALLGVNGAGKTTTIKILSCLSNPTSGEAYINNYSCTSNSNSVKSETGISPQETSVAENLTIRENLEFIASVYGFDKNKIKLQTDKMIQLFNMKEVENSRAKTLSGGWKRKLSIAMALISEPKVLFLDEPTLGLDVLARRELWTAIESLKGKITIILTTHYMEEAEHLSDKIAIMVNGRISAIGTLSEIEKIAGKTGLENAFVEIAERSMKNA
ncbi:MAG: ATP-binding cassette domain-containing protein [Ruminococcus sp.]|nr:ATP-binding cassette domain-containing protein [Ruminococcus sp.]MDE7105265.1 ATP-binding cassette domain-containing protein [Ruminococcus sp.]